MCISRVYASIFLLSILNRVSLMEILNQNSLQRGGKSFSWIWGSDNTQAPDIQRRRRYLIDEASAAWWNDMKALRNPSADGPTTANPLSPEEDIYFSGRGSHVSPFAKLEPLPVQANTTISATIVVDTPQHGDIDSTLLRELIIEEHHRPSKIELESASQRLRDTSENNTVVVETSSGPRNESGSEESSTIHSDASSAPEPVTDGPVSYVEYVVPGVEHVVSHVEFVNNPDGFRESEEMYHQPSVEYVEPSVEFVEPEIEYFATTRTSNISEKIRSFSLDDSSEEEYGRRYSPLNEVVNINKHRFLAVHNEEKVTSETKMAKDRHVIRQNSVRHQRIHRRNPRRGVPEVDYPTLEILPVVHFPCENYASAGYYADISTRCQMFHICHENGQRSSFLCPVGTVFNQEYLVCDWWYNVDCGNSLDYLMDDSYEAFGTSNQKTFDVASAGEEDFGSILPIKDKESQSRKLSLFPTTKNKPTSKAKLRSKEKSNSKYPNLSQKAINYPIGYAILLREFMKNSPYYSSSKAKDNHRSRELEPETHDDIDDASERAGSENKNQKIIQENDKNLKEVEKNNKVIKKQKKNQEYHGGSKPFAVSSEKRIHQRVKTKQIKIRYFPPRTLDFPTATEVKEPQTETADYRSLSEKESSKGSLKSRITRVDAAESVSENKDEVTVPTRNKTQISEYGNIPSHRNYYKIKNITEDFEVIHLPRRHNLPKRKQIRKYDNHNYTSAASVVNYKKEIYISSDDTDSVATPDDQHHSINKTRTKDKISKENSFPSRNRSASNSVLLRTNKTPAEHENEDPFLKAVNKKSYTTTYSESTTFKKSYVMEPKISLANFNKKYGERIKTKSLSTKSERMIASETTPVFLDEGTEKEIVTTSPLKQPFDEELDTTTQLTPVYVHTETLKPFDTDLKIRRENKNNDTIIIPRTINTNTKVLTEFDITNSFVNRISNLVSDIKEQPEYVQINNSLAKNQAKRENAYTISVRIEPKNVTNLNKSSNTKSAHNSSNLIKTWLINSPSSPYLYSVHDGNVTQNGAHFPHLWSEIANRNGAKINNAHGGFFVVKKVRLKRNIRAPQAHSNNRFRFLTEYLKTKFQNTATKFSRASR